MVFGLRIASLCLVSFVEVVRDGLCWGGVTGMDFVFVAKRLSCGFVPLRFVAAVGDVHGFVVSFYYCIFFVFALTTRSGTPRCAMVISLSTFH